MNHRHVRSSAIVTFIVGSALAATTSPVVSAQSVFERMLANGDCYIREYTGTHLLKNPKQTVKTFMVGADLDHNGSIMAPIGYAVRFAFQVVGDADVYPGLALCVAGGQRDFCEVEGDGGSFTLATGPRGRLLVRIESRLEVEGPNGASPNLAEGDNHAMLLPRGVDGECRTR